MAKSSLISCDTEHEQRECCIGSCERVARGNILNLRSIQEYKGLEMNAIHLSKFKKKNGDFRVRRFNDFINANSTITLQSRATLTAWQTIATVKWSRDATAARKNAINCRKASSNSRDETLSRWIMLKRLKSGINKQSAEGGAKGTERRRQYRRTRSSNSEDRA